jgi:hypothetical protein
MEKIAICSKILYDNDVIDKQNEIHELKKKINTPKIYFESKTLWNLKKEEIFKIIKDSLLNKIFEDDFDDILSGLNSSQKMKLNHLLYSELNKLTEFKYCIWCENKAWDISYSIEGAIQGLLYTGRLNDFTNYDIIEFIYKNITWQLGDNTHFPSILDDIPFFEKKIN